ncbi:hypothetical protein PIB30_042832 [Stylosanthes scabra]|uniref:Uncharacterized protein n=1 Tax=Stylosanthes scabra TaxID=79078 RepID=A0ABU6VGV3_9FABA|nr:hypothetical protein [Stylosanthes scabra]
MRVRLLRQPKIDPETTNSQSAQKNATTSVEIQEEKEESECNFQSQQQQQSQIDIEIIRSEPSTMHTSSLEIQEIKEVERGAEFDSPTKSKTTTDQAITDQESTIAILVNEKTDSYQEEQDDRHRENRGMPHIVGTNSISIEKANTSGDWSTDRNDAEDDAIVKWKVEPPNLEVTDVDARWRSLDRSRGSGAGVSRKSGGGFLRICSIVTRPTALLATVFPWDRGGEHACRRKIETTSWRIVGQNDSEDRPSTGRRCQVSWRLNAIHQHLRSSVATLTGMTAVVRCPAITDSGGDCCTTAVAHGIMTLRFTSAHGSSVSMAETFQWQKL